MLQRLQRTGALFSPTPAPGRCCPRPLERRLTFGRRGASSCASQQQQQRSTMATCFQGATERELQAWLEQGGVDTTQYGKGQAKTVVELLDEVQNRESVLEIEGGKALRIVNVLSLHILNSRGQVLFEEEQVLPDGRARRRGVPVSEKIIADEPWVQATARAVREELGSALPDGYQVTLFEDTYFSRTEYSNSRSYPGLLTKYIFHRAKAKVSGLPETSFSTVEPRPNGGQLLTRWVWRPPPPQETF